VAHLARWYVLLGLAAAVPAALLLGTSVGEALRRPGLPLATAYRYEAPTILLLVVAVLLFSTAAGMRHGHAWAHGMALAEAMLLAAGGLLVLVGGSPLLSGVGAPQVFVVFGIPIGLGAILLGARLIVSLRHRSGEVAGFTPADVRALVWLGLVAALGLAVHLALAAVIGSG
jgi:hypothetical protein